MAISQYGGLDGYDSEDDESMSNGSQIEDLFEIEKKRLYN